MYICLKKYNQTGHYTTRRITKICFFGADGIRHVETDANMPTATVFRLDLMNVILFGVTIYLLLSLCTMTSFVLESEACVVCQILLLNHKAGCP